VVCFDAAEVVHSVQPPGDQRDATLTDEHDISGPKPSNQDAPQQDVRREIVEFVKMVVWFLILFIVLKSYVIEGYEVQGPSMKPTLQNGERILVFKLPHLLSKTGLGNWLQPFEAGDIVVFESPDDGDKRYVKRVIAVGPKARSNTVQAVDISPDATEVEIINGDLYVNNQRIVESYLAPEISMTHEEDGPILVRPGDMYVLGDNRDVSKDSRAFGAVENERIIGRAALRFWPLSRFGIIQ